MSLLTTINHVTLDKETFQTLMRAMYRAGVEDGKEEGYYNASTRNGETMEPPAINGFEKSLKELIEKYDS